MKDMAEKWKPVGEEGYFYITFFDSPSKILYGNNDGKSGNDKERIEFGNCFKTKEQAEFAYTLVKEFLTTI